MDFPVSFDYLVQDTNIKIYQGNMVEFKLAEIGLGISKLGSTFYQVPRFVLPHGGP